MTPLRCRGNGGNTVDFAVLIPHLGSRILHSSRLVLLYNLSVEYCTVDSARRTGGVLSCRVHICTSGASFLRMDQIHGMGLGAGCCGGCLGCLLKTSFQLHDMFI